MTMFKMTLVQCGVLLLAICISAQSTTNGTTQVKPTTSNITGTYSVNATTAPAGAGVLLQAGTLSVLTPVIMAAFLLQRYC
uniref:Si:ch211-152c2.3 n=1 Tax=Nothobranchius kuhntae TaxID=321403 RepID=A0A1A8IM34_NOTKU